MSKYEYKLIVAPRRARAIKGVRRHEDRFASVLMELINQMASRDWEYLRADSLPCEEKSGLISRVASYQTMLVFRRRLTAEQGFFEALPKRALSHMPIEEDIQEAEKDPATLLWSKQQGDPVDMVHESANSVALAMLRRRHDLLAQRITQKTPRPEGWKPPRFRFRRPVADAQ